MTIHLLGYQEAKAREGQFVNSISINDHNIEPRFRVYGTKSTLELNFNDIWLNEQGEKTIWAGNSAYILPPDQAHSPLPSKEILSAVTKYLDNNPNFLHEESLIHCWAGVSRSSSIVLYILLREGLLVEEAMSAILSARPIARPNLILCGYMEEELNGKIDGSITNHLKEILDYTKLG